MSTKHISIDFSIESSQNHHNFSSIQCSLQSFFFIILGSPIRHIMVINLSFFTFKIYKAFPASLLNGIQLPCFRFKLSRAFCDWFLHQIMFFFFHCTQVSWCIQEVSFEWKKTLACMNKIALYVVWYQFRWTLAVSFQMWVQDFDLW